MTKLNQYFPLLKTRTEILSIIMADVSLKNTWYSWTEERREEFLGFCTGNRGMKILYDAYFKRIFDAEHHPEWLIMFLSVLLGRKVVSVTGIKSATPLIVENTPIFIFDVTVILDDGSFVNVEIQKHGYKFPGERAACYSSDLVLRQYMRARRDGNVVYSDLKNTYTIVIMEKSPDEFHTYKDRYMHHFVQKSDTGIELRLLQEYLFIPLDIFTENLKDKKIKDRNPLEVWLTFLTEETPAGICELIENFPFLKEIYAEIYRICENVEGAVRMYNEMLAILDQNTMSLMYDEVVGKNEALAARNDTLTAEINTLAAKNNTLAAKNNTLTAKIDLLRERDVENQRIIDELRRKLEEKKLE